MCCTDFAPGRGFPCISSPTLTESSVFAQDIQDILEANHQAYRGPPASPVREDKQWESQLQDALLETHMTSMPNSRPPSRMSQTYSPGYQPTPIPVASIARSACPSVSSPALFARTPPSSHLPSRASISPANVPLPPLRESYTTPTHSCILHLSLCPDRLHPVTQEDLTVLMACHQTTQGIRELAVAEDKSVEMVL